MFARVDAWQSVLYEGDEPDADFPYDRDADGDGVIYFLADSDTYEPAVIMDREEYEAWRANLTNGADEVRIEYEKLPAVAGYSVNG